MIDIDKAFRKRMADMNLNVFGTTSSVSKPEEPLTIEKLREAMRLVQDAPPSPIPLRASKYVPALGSVKPKATPHTDDMRTMCEDIGPQKIPVAYVMDTPFGRLAVTNPVNINTDE